MISQKEGKEASLTRARERASLREKSNAPGLLPGLRHLRTTWASALTTTSRGPARRSIASLHTVVLYWSMADHVVSATVHRSMTRQVIDKLVSESSVGEGKFVGFGVFGMLLVAGTRFRTKSDT